MPKGKWFMQDPRTCRWVETDEGTNRVMEAAFRQGQSSVEFTLQGVGYIAEFGKKRLYSLSSGGSRPIKREEVQASNPYELEEFSAKKLNMKEMEAFFEKHRLASDSDEQCIQGEGLLSMCKDLGISIDDDSLLLVACRIQAAEPFKIGRSEFLSAMKVLGIDSVKKLKAEIPKWRSALSEKRHFKYFYWFAFDWTREENARVMQADAAVDSWKVLLTGRVKNFPLDVWCDYALNVNKKAISKDAWKSLFDFIHAVAPDLSDYDEDEGWPVLMDEFVEWAKKNGKV